MILKLETENNSNRYKLIDNIKEFDYEYIPMRCYEKTLNEVVGKSAITGMVEGFVENPVASVGNFVLITICSKNYDGIRYILTNLSVYILNDKGDTIERIRY